MEDGKIQISVIVTAYNIEDFLPRCVESLLAQTYKQIEIILVDDGSTDKTPAICDKYAEEHENIRVLHQKMVVLLLQEIQDLSLQSVRILGMLTVMTGQNRKCIRRCLRHVWQQKPRLQSVPTGRWGKGRKKFIRQEIV